MGKSLQIMIGLSLLIAASSIGYYFVVALPESNMEKNRISEETLALEKQKNRDLKDIEIAKKEKLNTCLEEANLGHRITWDLRCFQSKIENTALDEDDHKQIIEKVKKGDDTSDEIISAGKGIERYGNDYVKYTDCLLPKDIADSLKERNRKSEEQCILLHK